MKKILLLVSAAVILMSSNSIAQLDLLNQLNGSNISSFAKPLATALGSGINSGATHSADVSSLFGFSISFRAMMINIPDDQLTYTPTLPAGYTATEPSPTVFGKKGGASYLGPAGYYVLPGGIDEKQIPFAMPQVAVSFLGTEAMLRFVPETEVGDYKISFLGLGLKHNISRYIPLLPFDFAVQGMYNKVDYGELIKGTNIAANVQASKTLGVFTAYGALQYEKSNFDLSYTFEGEPTSNIPELRDDKKIAVSVEGDNKFRVILGGTLKLAFLAINADINLGSQMVYSGGLSFEF